VSGVVFTGVAAQTLLTALLVGAGVLLVWFFLRPRPIVLAVPSHVLWKQVVPRRLDPLFKEIIALLLQLVVLALVLGALGQPRKPEEPAQTVDLDGVVRPFDRIVVVDLSASMAAVDDGVVRLESVKQRLQALVDDLADGERMALVRAGADAAVAVPLTGDRQRLGLAVRSLQPLPGRADLDDAVAHAVDLVSTARQPAEVRVFADSDVPAPEPGDGWVLVIEPVGGPAANVAVTAFDVRATEGLPAQIEAFVQVTNFAPVDARVTVSVETPTEVLGRASYDVAAWESLERIYHFYPPDSDQVEVVLEEIGFADEGTVDALALDDRAYAFLPGLRPARVLLVSRGNQYLRAALSLVPGLKLEEVTPAQYSRSRAASGRFDVVFYDSFLPDDPPRVNSFFINPTSAASGFSLARRVEAPVTTGWNLGHPLFANLVMRDLNVAVSGQFEPGPHDDRLIDTPTGPIALAREQGGVRQVVLGFDFADSDLPLRIAFPQLIFNTVLWMREGRAVTPAAGPSLLARDGLWLRPEEGTDGVTVEPLLDGEQTRRLRSRPVGDGERRVFLDETGFFAVGGHRELDVVAVSMLDPVESDLGGTPVRPIPPATPPAPEPEPLPEPIAPPWFWLGVVALVLMLGEFVLVNR
jgi:Ca-activated chloride channel homolog